MKQCKIIGNVINKCIVRRNRSMPIIYKTINHVNGKIYIGKANINDPKYLGSGLKILAAIKKYGKTNFSKEIIEECEVGTTSKREKYWIHYYNSTDDTIGYNISIGGEGGDHYWATLTDAEKRDHNLKISESKKGKLRSPHTEETKKKIKDNQPNNPEWYEIRAERKRKWFTIVDHLVNSVIFTKNLKEFCIANKLIYGNMLYNSRVKKTMYEHRWSCRVGILEGNTEDIIKKINTEIQIASILIKSIVGKQPKNGAKNPMFNKKHTNEAKQKIRESKKKHNETR